MSHLMSHVDQFNATDAFWLRESFLMATYATAADALRAAVAVFKELEGRETEPTPPSLVVKLNIKKSYNDLRVILKRKEIINKRKLRKFAPNKGKTNEKDIEGTNENDEEVIWVCLWSRD